MNKKFSTLVAGVLLASSVGLTAEAVSTVPVDGNLAGLAQRGDWFKLHVGTTKNTEATAEDSVLVVKEGILRLDSAKSVSNAAMWKVTTVKTNADGPVFEFVNMVGDVLNFPAAELEKVAGFKATTATGDVNQLRFWESGYANGPRYLSDRGPAEGWTFGSGYYLYKENGSKDADSDGYKYSLFMYHLNAAADATNSDVQGLSLAAITPEIVLKGNADVPVEKVEDVADAVGSYSYIASGAGFLTIQKKTTRSSSANQLVSVTNMTDATLWKISETSVPGYYTYTSLDGTIKLAFDKDGNFDEAGAYSAFAIVDNVISYLGDGGAIKYLKVEDGKWITTNTKAEATAISIYKSEITTTGTVKEQIAYLNGQLGNSFELSFKKGDGSKDLTVVDNPFVTGQITSVEGMTFATNADLVGKMFLKVKGSYPLTNEDKNDMKKQLAAFRSSEFIAVDTIRYSAQIADDQNNNFFKYTTVKGSDMVSSKGYIVTDATVDGTLFGEGKDLYGVTRRHENAVFEVAQYVGATYKDPVYIKSPKVYEPIVGNSAKGLLTHKLVADANTGNAIAQYVAVKEFDGKNYVGAYVTPYDNVRFGSNNQVKQKDLLGVVNIISRNYKTDGKVYANDDNSTISPIAASRIVLHNPEGQFYVTANEAHGFTFKNRESQVALYDAAVTLKKVAGKENVYAVSNGDTLQITAATVGNKFDGYADYDKANQLENKAFNILVKSSIDGVENLYLKENHSSDHTVGVTTEAADAINWRLVKFTDGKSVEAQATDTIYRIRENAYSYLNDDKEYKTKNDTIAMFAYALYNEANNEYLSYNNEIDKKAYICNPKQLFGSIANARQTVNKFILKEKNDGTYNMVLVNGTGAFDDTEDTYDSFEMSDEKAYIGVNDTKLNKESTIYKMSDNDLFIIKEVDAPKYRSVASFDTIRIYKNDNEKIALYERGQFLGMQHTADVTDMASAMFADTAYVSNTNKPQYLLVVEPNLIYHNDDCNVPGHPAVAPTMVDTVKGRFLVNTVDSMIAWGNKHDNPYAWDNYPKLAFVKGAHASNKLIIDRVKPTSADTIDLSKNVDKIGTFAFRYVDRSAGSFVMETGNKGASTTGYIKWLNGTPVVVPSIALAEVFNLKEISEKPTSNDAITASEVSIIAGTGSVVVKGAAGKSVAISNILGQTIVNTALTSDNATITVPAGIVVVAVEGEEAAKVVVR